MSARFAQLFFITLALSAALPGSRVYAATITGTVFEDVSYGGGAGRSSTSAGGAGIPGVRVEIYSGTGGYQGFVTTNTAGFYTYTYSGNSARRIRIVNGTVRSTRSGGTTCTTC